MKRVPDRKGIAHLDNAGQSLRKKQHEEQGSPIGDRMTCSFISFSRRGKRL